MDTMHFDDGQDMFAPPMPESDTPPQPMVEVIEDATQMYWALPLACLVSCGLLALIVYGLVALLK